MFTFFIFLGGFFGWATIVSSFWIIQEENYIYKKINLRDELKVTSLLAIRKANTLTLLLSCKCFIFHNFCDYEIFKCFLLFRLLGQNVVVGDRHWLLRAQLQQSMSIFHCFLLSWKGGEGCWIVNITELKTSVCATLRFCFILKWRQNFDVVKSLERGVCPEITLDCNLWSWYYITAKSRSWGRKGWSSGKLPRRRNISRGFQGP